MLIISDLSIFKSSFTEKQTVTISTGHLVATAEGKAELSCQLSPPQNAEHMEVQWFRKDNSKLVLLYRGGQTVNEEAAPEYVGRTEFLKEAIGKGKVTLRIHNTSVPDNGIYLCSFKANDFDGIATMNLSVVALGVETQIDVQQLVTAGFLVECASRGWFPQPQMEWKDSRGVVVPPSSISYAQDESGLFRMKMTLFLQNQSHSNITCFIHNPLTTEWKQTTVILTGEQSAEGTTSKIG
ncbi:selection and upkeep of intraepithelial T-cells protein 7-like [Erinaceus europaeus]|uniref:Selection and upkeep of intraepithelial T-cells protein 7-like n=1 Tax=Erinaceus europaeus TaxID=9365 RepID=A0ABM3YIN7_ERIEU|nr:selection and upkeep of intraepithelial T-cells protein 7-like [Erinaceus europaeus]